jgi:flagellum-specific peptidoglycan hydrolase FlgJ
MTEKEFVQIYGGVARRVTSGTGIFPETLLAQAYVESGGGKSLLSAKYKNFFGIKAGTSWKGTKVVLKTREVINSKDIIVPAAFRVYASFADSARDYVELLTKGKNFQAAKVTSSPTYQEQIRRIKAAGYATDPKYVQVITSVANRVQVPGPNIVLTAGLLFVGWKAWQKIKSRK